MLEFNSSIKKLDGRMSDIILSCLSHNSNTD